MTTGSINASLTTSSVNFSSLAAEASIPDMMIAIQLERSNVLDSQIKDQMADMQKRNNWLKDANAALQQLRTNQPATSDADCKSYGTFTGTDGQQHEVNAWCNANGIKVETLGDDVIGTQAEFQAAIDNAKSTIDSVNSQSQMDMVRLQSLMDKRNQAFDLITNTLSKTSKQLDSIIGNLR